MSDAPPDTLLVSRCTDQNSGFTATGTIVCSRCKLDCWIAPTSIAAIIRWPSIQVMCLDCAAELEAKHGPTIQEVGLAPGGAEEFADALFKHAKNKRR